jgi:hypothetical protein
MLFDILRLGDEVTSPPLGVYLRTLRSLLLNNSFGSGLSGNRRRFSAKIPRLPRLRTSNQNRIKSGTKSNQKRTDFLSSCGRTIQSEPKSKRKRTDPEPKSNQFRNIEPKLRITHCKFAKSFRFFFGSKNQQRPSGSSGGALKMFLFVRRPLGVLCQP